MTNQIKGFLRDELGYNRSAGDGFRLPGLSVIQPSSPHLSPKNQPNRSENRDERTITPTPASRLSRRLFMSAAAVGLAGLGSSSNRSAAGFPQQRASSRVRWRFNARRVEQTFLDGSSLPFFRFVAVGNTRSNGLLPLMQDTENHEVSVSISNSVDFPIQPTILDYATGPVIMPGARRLWNFTMPPAGIWMFTESLLGNAASSAGFAAAMISNSSRVRQPQRNYYLMYQDADDRWNNAIDSGEVPDESSFQPNYHTLNGLSYPQTLVDRSTRINCLLGENVLIRVANLSNIRQSLHFHGYHVQLTHRNNLVDDSLPPKDSFDIPAYSTAELVLPVDQVGEFPLHPHILTTTTDNGVYLGGSHTMIDAQ